MRKRFVVGLLLALSVLSCSVDFEGQGEGEGEEKGADAGAVESGTGVSKSPRTQIVLLGTGTPNAEADRSGPAVAIVVDDTPYLVDLGPGVVRRAAGALRNGVEGLAASKLGYAFVTHLHTDHTLGYADFIFTPWVLERDVPAEVFGPKGLQTMTDHLLAAYEEDIRIRIDGLEPANTEGYRVNVHEIEPGLVHEDERVRVTAFPVNHGSWAQAFGFRFETPDRTIVISGDTGPSESVVENCQRCDYLIHEVYSQAGFERREPVWQTYHSSSHTSSLELGAIAARARPRTLILYHQLLWGSTPEELLAEIASVWDGKVVYGQDLDVF